MTRYALWCGILAAGLGLPAWAQNAGPGAPADDPMARPSEYGIRFTPEMARGIAKEITRGLFVRRYELDESKADQATELMARRFMEFAHQNEEACQDTIEFAIGEMTNQIADRHGQNMPGLPKSVAQGVGTRLLPIMPAIREMINGTMQDVRPMLSLKQQLRFTGEMTAANIALDAFEKNMRKWSSGEVEPEGNPFRDPDREPRKDENGESQALRSARLWAENESNRAPGSAWEQYVEEAKKYYELDPSQAASVDSLLRDYQERARVAVGDQEQWRARLYRNRFLWNMSIQLPGRWQANPVRILLENEYVKMQEPLEALGDELKQRIDEVPTQAQRAAAEHRMRNLFAEKGLQIEEAAAATTERAAPTETAPAEEVAE
jgi:hypothetical protein